MDVDDPLNDRLRAKNNKINDASRVSNSSTAAAKPA
jgi:hypothetical protein